MMQSSNAILSSQYSDSEAALSTAKKVKGPGKRHKGPVDLSVQCGAINDKGLPCPRALTCKSHSMGAKRAVEGRGESFDILLHQLQIRNNPELVNAPIPRKAQAIPPTSNKKKKKHTRTTGLASWTEHESSQEEEHEIAPIVKVLKSWRPKPAVVADDIWAWRKNRLDGLHLGGIQELIAASSAPAPVFKEAA